MTGAYADLTRTRQEQLGLTWARTCEDLRGFASWTVEFGSGHGHFLASYAAAHPSVACVGIDFCSDRIRRAHRKQERQGLPNLRFVRAEAWEFLQIAGNEPRFSQAFVLFPDPWPKRRHWKNRLISKRFLDQLATACEVGAGFFFRSDAADYAQHVRTLITDHRSWRLTGSDHWPHECASVFQQRAAAFESIVAVNSG